MANFYVSSVAGSNTAPYDTWAKAAILLSTAATASAAGDTIYVAQDHAETTAGAVTITAPGTVTTPTRILCVNRAGTVPPVSADLATTATVSTTGANAINLGGFFYCYGITFQSNSAGAAGGGGIGLAATSGNQQRYDSCVFRMLSTAASLLTTSSNSAVYLNNCSIRFGAATSAVSLGRARFVWSNSPTAIDAAGTLPTTLFAAPGGPAYIWLEGVDLSAISAKTIFAAAGFPVEAMLKDCKLPASITISASQTLGLGQGNVTLIRSDSGATNYRTERHNYAGTQTTETTVVRTGGATDAFKVVTTANSRWADPFTCVALSIWNNSTSAATLTVYGTWATGSAVPNKEDIWIDVEYLGSASFPQGSFISSGNADILATAANTSDGSTWGGAPAGGGTPTPFKMAVTLTAGMVGPLTIYVRCARASTNAFYIDPKPVLS